MGGGTESDGDREPPPEVPEKTHDGKYEFDDRLEQEFEEFLEPHGRAGRMPQSGWRVRLRRTRAGSIALKAGVFVLGATFIVVGFLLAVFPGPLTIPPILLGLYILASEFEWADSLFQRARSSGEAALEQARQRPVVTGISTAVGFVVLGVGIWAFGHYDVLARARDAVGL